MTSRAVLVAAAVAAAFVVGQHAAKARTSVISDMSVDQVGSSLPSCGTTPMAPEQSISRFKEWLLTCTYTCPNNPEANCSPHTRTHKVTVTGKCGVVACEPNVGDGSEYLAGTAPNQEHRHEVFFQNTFINSSNQCQVSSQGNDESNIDAVYDDEVCSEEACPGQATEIEECNAGESTWWNYQTCECITSPIIVDLDGDGLALTPVARGARFDLDRDGRLELLSWPARRGRDGFLVLDRNRNGRIDDGGELFGSTTDQPSVRKKDGFLALRVFDSPAEGGNGDGTVDRADSVFARLRIWFDLDHDGLSQSHELVQLDALGITSVGLDYQLSTRTDSVGNVYRYIGNVKVRSAGGVQERPAIDVFLSRRLRR